LTKKDTDCSERQLAYFAQDKDILCPHFMQIRLLTTGRELCEAACECTVEQFEETRL